MLCEVVHMAFQNLPIADIDLERHWSQFPDNGTRDPLLGVPKVLDHDR